MGLFSKKEACPVCGGEVKGLFLTKIADKKKLCKDCAEKISMHKELLKSATPEFIREHLEVRRQNAERFNSIQWEREYTDIPNTNAGVDRMTQSFYLLHEALHDEKNPVVFSFSQLTGYELHRLGKKIDDASMTGEIEMETFRSKMRAIARAFGKRHGDVEYFDLRLTTTDPYWPNIRLKIYFYIGRRASSGYGDFEQELRELLRVFKSIIRMEPVNIAGDGGCEAEE